MKTFHWVRGLSLASVLVAGAASAGDRLKDDLAASEGYSVYLASAAAGVPAANPLAENVRVANSRFKDVAAAVAEGYSPIPCASGIDGGAMGIHYVNPNYLKDDAIDVAKPEAVMYEPTAGGKMTLIAVEYITSKGPAELQGHLFSFNGAPNRYGLGPFYELHVWAWKANPKGTFADMNMNVSCDAMTAAGM